MKNGCKSSARTRYHTANEASDVSTKWKENHTPPVLIDYETDLQQYDRKLCPTLERLILIMIQRNLQDACKSLHLSYIMDHYDEISFETKEQFLRDIFNIEIESRQTKKVATLIKKQNFES